MQDDRINGASDPPAGRVLLRDVQERDLPVFFEDQRDPAANEMAAFPARDREAFVAHWAKILADDSVFKQSILFGDRVAGNIVCFERSGKRLVGYWVGKDFWGMGIATRALSKFVAGIKARPPHAYVAKHNLGSIRVLEKCGFTLSGEGKAPSSIGGEAVEILFTLAG